MSDRNDKILAHADDVWRIAVRLLSDEDDAHECFQQTFADALRVRDPNIKDWRSLLCKIATRRAMDGLRKRYRDRSRLSLDVVEPAQEMPPDASLRLGELRESVRRVLVTLPPMQAEAFVLRHIEQWEPAQIADQMGIPPNHVRVLVHRALVQIRDSLPSSFQLVETHTSPRRSKP